MLSRTRLLSQHLKPTPNSAKAAKAAYSIRNMSKFTLPDSNVTVELVDGLERDELMAFPAFKNWLSTLINSLSLQSSSSHEFHKQPYALHSIQIQSIDRFGGKRIGFLKLKATVKNEEDESLPGSVFLRGASVGMLVILQPDDVPKDSTDDLHVLLTIQPRIPASSLAFAELPAGMVDDGTFSGAAAKEIEEELALKIPEAELVNLTELACSLPSSSGSDAKASEKEELPKAMFPSAGGSDEHIPIFMHMKRVPRKSLDEWSGKLTGLRDDGEKITLKLVKFDDLWIEGVRDAKALAAWALWTGLKRKGKL